LAVERRGEARREAMERSSWERWWIGEEREKAVERRAERRGNGDERR